MVGFHDPSAKIGQSGQALTMRHIILTEDGVHPVDDALFRLLAVCYFPDSPRDQVQSIFLARMERDEFRRVGEVDYRPSEIFNAAVTLVEKRLAQQFSVGFVALSFLWLKINGMTPSLNRAALIASCAAYEFDSVTWRPALRPSGEVASRSVTADASSVERLFRKYRSVAHILAARIICSPSDSAGHVLEDHPEETAAFIQTCAAVQGALENATDTTRWNLWDVRKYFPSVLGGTEASIPDENLQFWVRRGYEIAVEEGKIRAPVKGG